MITVGTVNVEDGPQETDHLQANHVKGEGIRVVHRCCRANRALISPSLVAHIEDEDEEREEEEEVGDAEGCRDVNAQSDGDAIIRCTVEGGAGG